LLLLKWLAFTKNFQIKIIGQYYATPNTRSKKEKAILVGAYVYGKSIVCGIKWV
jgi:hypothetical protein